jgi:transposase
MRRRQLKSLWKRLQELQNQKKLKRDDLLKKLGAALHDYPAAARLVQTSVEPHCAQLKFQLRKDKLKEARKREGRYLLRSNIHNRSPEELWSFYIQLTHVEEAFKNLKDDLSLRPIYHQLERRIEAHIMISFLAYCLQATLRRRLRDLAPGLTPRAVLEKLATLQMLDVHLPTTDGRTLVMSRYTQPSPDVQLLLQRMRWDLPPQPPPRILAPKPPELPAP